MSSAIEEIESLNHLVLQMQLRERLRPLIQLLQLKIRVSPLPSMSIVVRQHQMKEKKPESKRISSKYFPSYPAQNTSNMRRHLKNIHGITINKAPESGIHTTATETIEALYSQLLLRLSDSKEDVDKELLPHTVN